MRGMRYPHDILNYNDNSNNTDLIWIIHLFQDIISLPWGLHNLNKEGHLNEVRVIKI